MILMSNSSTIMRVWDILKPILQRLIVSVLDKNGPSFLHERKVAAVADAEKLNEFGMTDRGYMEAEGIKVKNGTLYLGLHRENGRKG